MQRSNTLNADAMTVDQHCATTPTLTQTLSHSANAALFSIAPTSPSRSFSFTHPKSGLPTSQTSMTTFTEQPPIQTATPPFYPTSHPIPTPAPHALLTSPQYQINTNLTYHGAHQTVNLTYSCSPVDFVGKLSAEEEVAVRQSLAALLDSLDVLHVPSDNSAPSGETALRLLSSATLTKTPTGENLLDWGWRMFQAGALPASADNEPEKSNLAIDQWYKESLRTSVAVSTTHEHLSPRQVGFPPTRPATPSEMHGNDITLPLLPPMPIQYMNPDAADPITRQSAAMGPAPVTMYHGLPSLGPTPVRPLSGPNMTYPAQRGSTPALSPMSSMMYRSPSVGPPMSPGLSPALSSQPTPYNGQASGSPSPFTLDGRVTPAVPRSLGPGRYTLNLSKPSIPTTVYSPVAPTPLLHFDVTTAEQYGAQYRATSQPIRRRANSGTKAAPKASMAASGSTLAATSSDHGSKRKRDAGEEQTSERVVLPRNEDTMRKREDGSALRRATLTRAALLNEPAQPADESNSIEDIYAPAT